MWSEILHYVPADHVILLLETKFYKSNTRWNSEFFMQSVCEK
jgi:hypothetical protein